MPYTTNMADVNTLDKVDGMTVTDFEDRLSDMKTARQPWESKWDDFATYILPRREVKEPNDNGKKTGKEVYNEKAVEDIDTFGEGLLGHVIAPQQRWFAARVPFRNLDDNHDVKLWLQIVEDGMYWALSKSNFYDVMIEFFKDGGTFGTAYMYSEEMLIDGRIRFLTEHYFKMYIQEDEYGLVDTVYRVFEMSARQAVKRFGKENLSPALVAANDTGTKGQKFQFIHAVQPRKSRDEGKIDDKNKPFLSVYIEQGEKTFISEAGFNDNPWVVWRLSKNTDEVYGRGLGDKALVDILSVNNMAKSMLVISQKLADPGLLAKGKFKNRVTSTPGITTYTDDPNAQITPIFTGNNYNVLMDQIRVKEEAISRKFLVDFFLLLNRRDATMTATEVMELQGEKASLLGSVIGRLNSEVLDQVVSRVFEIEFNAGRIPPPPQVLIENLGEAQVEIEYFGPLAQVQKRQFASKGITNSLATIIPLSELRPEILDKVNFDGVVDQLFEANNTPTQAQNDDETVRKIREARAQAQAEAIQQQQALAQAEQVPNLSKAPEAGSPIAVAQEQAGA